MPTRTCVVTVTTFDKDDEFTAQRVIDHNYREAHDWLVKHIYWAVRNEHAVEITPGDVSE